jgi:hypothetical protein
MIRMMVIPMRTIPEAEPHCWRAVIIGRVINPRRIVPRWRVIDLRNGSIIGARSAV